jgi:tetratricopeptide (TPR) repeat protein
VARIQGGFTEALELQQIIHDLASQIDEQTLLIRSVLAMADVRLLLGQYKAALLLLYRVQESDVWSHANVFDKAYALYILGHAKQCTDVEITGVELAAIFQESYQLYSTVGEHWNANLAIAAVAFAFVLIGEDLDTAQTGLEQALSSLQMSGQNESDALNIFQYLAAIAAERGEIEATRQYLTVSRMYSIQKNILSHATVILLYLAMCAASRGDLGNAEALIAQANEEAKTHTIWSHNYRWLSLYCSGVVELVSNRLTEAQRFFQETKMYCEAQQQFQFRAFSARAMGEIAYMQKNMVTAQAHFSETVKICEEAGIVPSLLYRRADLFFFRNAPPATYEGWPLFLRGSFPLV